MLGAMLDCSRNGVPTLDGLKNFILTLEKIGYNCLQLYTEDTYEIDGEPLFGYMRGRFTKAELKSADEFAKAHNVELMPCIQTLAHINQITGYPHYQEILDVADILFVGEEKTYALIEKMFAACAECYTSRRIHIGMDEAHLLGLGKYLDKHGYENRSKIFLKHLNRVCLIAEKYGFKPMMWSDMFFRLAFGTYYRKGGVIPSEVKSAVPKNLELVFWEYYSQDEEYYSELLNQHKTFSRGVWFSGGAIKWMGFHSANAISIAATRAAMSACRKNLIDNVMFTIWGDDGDECPIYAVLPSLVYAAECYKGNDEIENSKNRFNELFGENWDDFMLCDMPLEVDVKKQFSCACGAKEMLYNDCFLGHLDSAVSKNGLESVAYSVLAKKLAVAEKRSPNFGYMFKSYRVLAEFMALKYDLGSLTRTSYLCGDVNALRVLVSRYGAAVKKLEQFIEVFRKMWFTYKKPHGFDVQELRLGGVLERLKSCKTRLNDYICGKIAKIDELEEEVVDYFTGGKPEAVIIQRNDYARIVTPNVLHTD